MSERGRRSRLVVGTPILVSLLLMGACGRSRDVAESRAHRADRSGTVRVAVVWPWASRSEIRFAEGLEMAVGEVNGERGAGGRPLEIVRFDDRESVDEGRLIAERIAADPGIVAVIGHLHSYISVPAAAIYERGGLVMVSPTATDVELTSRGYRSVFRVPLTDAEVGRQMAEIAARRGYQRLAVYYVRNGYGRGLANAFEERATRSGLAVVTRQSYDPGSAASGAVFEQTLEDWKDLEMDAIFVAGEVPSAARFVALARKLGIRTPILGGDAMGARSLLTEAGPAAEGMVVASFFHPDEPRPEVRAFVAAFRSRYGGDPDVGSALAYDSVRLLANAVRSGASAAPAAIATELRQGHGGSGVTGPFTFDEQGNRVGQRVVSMVVNHGRFEFLREPQVASAAASRLP
jgi:branched-chain amino acid transport system substrate-binding protein